MINSLSVMKEFVCILQLCLFLHSLYISLPSPSVLCSDRVGQVTKTYHDIKAVTHLLEEVRERHTADERDYGRLNLSASLTVVVCHTFLRKIS